MKPPRPPEAQARRKGDRLFLRTVMFCTGASALVLEILGSRLISPYYGSSLYCWSALITVTLAALAAGYAWGGRLADRTPALTLAARLLAAAAFSCALVPSLREPALRATSPLGVQWGALAAALVLVAPTLMLLSALGPLAVRLEADSLAMVGRSAGGVYSLSTVGSVVGAFLAGFVLIPRAPLSQILYGISILLLLLSTWGHHLSQLRLPLAQPAIAAAVALFGFWPRPAADTNVVLNRESAYGQIKVLDTETRRYLLVNGTSQSVAMLPDMRSESPYARTMELAAAARPKAKRALVIGLGAGLLTTSLEKRYGLVVDTVELDPAIADAARRFFGFAPNGRVHVEDGRTFLERPGETYDLIFLDAFGAEAPPFHLFTVEAFAAMRRRLAPDGILAVNLVSALHGEPGKGWRSAYRTMSAVFPNVKALCASEPMEDLGNVVFLAGAAELPDRVPAKAPADMREDAAAALARPLDPAEGHAELLTDDYAPLESMLAETSVRWRRGLQKRVASILLY